MKKNLLIITGSRAEYGLFKTTILKLRQSKLFNIKLLVTGMHTLDKYGMTAEEIKKDIPIDCLVPIGENDSMMTALLKEIEGVKNYLEKEKVDAILVIGDRDEPFAAAIVGLHNNIPLIHISGGDTSGPGVDQYIRSAITIFSQLHLVQTKKSKKNVIRLGAYNKNVHIVGSAGLDGLTTSSLYSKKEVANRLGLSAEARWFLFSMHPTPFDIVPVREQIHSVIETAKKIENKSEKIILYPNSDTGAEDFINEIKSLEGQDKFFIFQNLDRKIYLSLLYHCQALIGNTSSGLMEAGYLKKPFVNVGNRQQGRERGVNTIEAFYKVKSIMDGIKKAESDKFQRRLKSSKPVYQGGDVSGRIVHLIDSFLNHK
jgi:GDP/UDP-N,N'-diacetylbacillosamine 2-epimerase (hydrolysing)